MEFFIEAVTRVHKQPAGTIRIGPFEGVRFDQGRHLQAKILSEWQDIAFAIPLRAPYPNKRLFHIWRFSAGSSWPAFDAEDLEIFAEPAKVTEDEEETTG